MCLCGFDEDRQRCEPRIGEQSTKRRQADASLADVLVAIDAAAARPFRVVAVEYLQPLQPHQLVECIERIPIARLGRDVVPRRDEMTGV